jgi:pimeloyl-ACP methyl ester carboxylesterase
MVSSALERPIQLPGAGGITLVGHEVGRSHDPPVVLLHGGGQTRHAWGATARRLAAAGFRAIALDHRGHGDSQWSPDGEYSLSTFADDVKAITDAIGRPPVVVGASIGGLAAMLAEGEQGPLLRALVLVDVAPRLEPDGIKKVVSFMNTGIDGFASLEEAAEVIAAYLPHRPKRQDLGGLAKNLRQGSDGRWRWHWDPRFVRRGERGDPSFKPERLVASARALTLPTLLVRGKMSDVISEQAVREFRDLVPHAAFVDVAGAHHMVAGDDNDAFSAGVLDWLTTLPDA